SAVTSPPEHAVAYWQHVQHHAERLNEGRQGIFSRLDVTLQQINSGQDGAFGWAESVIGFRLPPDVDPYQLAADLTPEDGSAVTAYGHERTYVADKNNALSRALRQAIRAQGGTPRFVHKTGTSDMNIVGPVWNCPIVAYGPGDSSLDHTPNEHISLDEYLQAIDVLASMLSNL
ncbi:MAG: M20/M25/M40 family metallo-hydrolase, partial [Anaerolineae bacterium]|nr:M20/M25/M40 family metallo-hydrolase [Anaerolineae bacterium]